ncbi:MAG: aldose epimerase [Cyanobacteria bacterium P01_A01_bin.3]
MFEVNSASELYSTVYLHDRTTDSYVTVVPERGGIITGIQIGDRQLLYLDRERFANPELSVRGGIPILFPICGNLPGDRYVWKGQEYTLPQHGFGRNLPWTVVSSSTEGAASLTLTLTHTPETLTVYPFQFELKFTYRWAGTSLIVEQQFHNHSADVMPMSIGFHPYYSVGDKELLQFDIPTQNYVDRANDVRAEFLGTWDTDLAEIDAAFEPIERGQPLVAAVSDGDRRVNLRADPYFRHLVFWTVKEKPFYCLEPWSAPRDAINSGTDLLLLDSGATLNTTLSLEFQIHQA